MLSLALPPPDLAEAVDCGVAVRRPAGGWQTRFPAMPRAMLTAAFGPGGGVAVHFHALCTRPLAHRHEGPVHAVGLVLAPATAARLLGPSTGALVDATLPWGELAGEAEAGRVEEQLAAADDDKARLQLLAATLRRTLARGPERQQRSREQALRRLCAEVGRQGSRAAGPLGLGERRLERHCRALLGLSPKRLQRLTRLHGVLAQAVREQRLPGADAALAAGYYDQSHLAREVRELAGAPLRELLAGARADGDWWPLATQRAGLLRHHR